MKNDSQKKENGFTLIETLVAISLLMLALVAPMSLAAQSLAAAYYSRSQITAFYLAQEGIEVVRSLRDANILADAEGGSTSNVFTGIPYGTTAANAPAFTVDSTLDAQHALHPCASSACPPLQTTGSIYGYAACEPSVAYPNPGSTWNTSDCGSSPGWTDTTFTRTVHAYLTSSGINSNPNDPQELRVSVTVSWVQGALQSQKFTINEDLYAWLSGT